MNRHFSKDDIQMANRHSKTFSHHQPLRKCKLTSCYLYIPIIIIKIKMTAANAGEIVEKLNHSYTAGGKRSQTVRTV